LIASSIDLTPCAAIALCSRLRLDSDCGCDGLGVLKRLTAFLAPPSSPTSSL